MLRVIIFTALVALFLPFDSVAKRSFRHGVLDPNDTSIPHTHTIEDALLFQDIIRENKNLVDDPKLLNKDICEITEKEWDCLQKFLVAYAIDSEEINYTTGSLNFTTLGGGNDDVIDDFYAAKCDEAYNLQPDMDSKIAFIFRGYLSRRSHCIHFADRQIACKEDLERFI